ncbi:hypothetical protein K461DRAFT_280812 [Myriangium duriaei CBS 260.36]|uniref:Pentacotripeptide-repeat region of PRORP domain-containing protein n=1 Tax=Myriangium duriaei CBS 260.36 TaxID=1168546 RepID=A0A9P4MIA1_9PEZI|nr:hypothetical protein K461DRAFT_280812 [Myriangium duriaei CBS 260.36]
MFSICSRCRLRLAARAPASIVLHPIRSYAQSIDTILDSPTRDDLTRALDPVLHPPRKRRYNPRSIASRSRLAEDESKHEADAGEGKRAEYGAEESRSMFSSNRTYANSKTNFVPSLNSAMVLVPSTDPDINEIRQLLHQDRFQDAWVRTLALLDDYAAKSLKEKREQKAPVPFICLKRVLWWYKSAWLRKLTKNDPQVSSLPTLLELAQALQGRFKYSDEMINVHALRMASVVVRYNSQENTIFQVEAHRQLLHELMDFWSVWIGGSRDHPSEDYASAYSVVTKDHDFSPPEDADENASEKLDTGSYMFQLNSKFKERGERHHMVDFSLCLLSVLRKAVKTSNMPPESEKYIHFLRDMNEIIRASSFYRYAKTLSSTLQNHGLQERNIKAVLRFLQEPFALPGKGSVRPEKAAEQPNAETPSAIKQQAAKLPVDELASRVTTSLARYLERQNLDLVEQSWHATRPRLSTLSAEEKAGASANTIYEEFLLTFRALRRADYTLDVWNHMINNECIPTVRTWNVMLKGCHIGKEVDAMEDIWRRMIRAGIRPNAHSWGIRIHGLFQFRKISEGYGALAEMTEAAYDSNGTGRGGESAPKPDTVILNSALSGAARHGPEPVKKLLTWARGQRISFDIITYNILINVAMNTGRKEDARQIMQKMAAEGIPPDSATFTILLHSMFRDGFLSDLDSAQQEAHAMDFIQSLEKDGMSLDVRGYALLLDRLLKTCQNIKATKAVLDHMIQRGIEPTAHMYTILVTHYFSLDPPDIDAVEALWQRIRSKANYAVDVIFYDRMLEGFARTDESTKMMYFLQRMGQEGKRPGWMALIAVLQCLLRKGDTARAKELIKDVERSEGNIKSGVRGRKGEENFWSLAKQVK